MKKLNLIILLSIMPLMGGFGELFTPAAGVGLYPFTYDYSLGTSTEPGGGGDGAAVYMDVDLSAPLAPVLQATSGTAGIGHVWYETTEDTIIDAAFATSTPFFYNAFGGANGQINMNIDQPFFIAFRLGGFSTPAAGDVYGWAELMWDGSDLQLLDSAAENDGLGIIAGTYTQVPEPATVLLFGLGGFCAWFLRRKVL